MNTHSHSCATLMIIIIIIICSVWSSTKACFAPTVTADGGMLYQNGGNNGPHGLYGLDPVDLADGAYTTSATDLVVKGKMRDIIIKRYYRSEDTTIITANGTGFFAQPQVQTDSICIIPRLWLHNFG
jgi:hypothetical protein